MQDPNPENIMGRKTETSGWSADFEINVAYTIIAVVVAFVAWKVFGGVSSSSSERSDSSEPQKFGGITDRGLAVEIE